MIFAATFAAFWFGFFIRGLFGQSPAVVSGEGRRVRSWD